MTGGAICPGQVSRAVYVTGLKSLRLERDKWFPDNSLRSAARLITHGIFGLETRTNSPGESHNLAATLKVVNPAPRKGLGQLQQPPKALHPRPGRGIAGVVSSGGSTASRSTIRIVTSSPVLQCHVSHDKCADPSPFIPRDESCNSLQSPPDCLVKQAHISSVLIMPFSPAPTV